MLPAGASVAGRDSHPQGESAFPRRTRRFVLDNPPETEKREILEEAQRLKDLYYDKIYIQIDLRKFIELGKLSLGDTSKIEPILNRRVRELPLALKAAIGVRVKDDKSLLADWMLSWLLCHPKPRWNIPSVLYWDEFQELFKLRFDEQYPSGLHIMKPRIQLTSTYEAISGEFTARLKFKLDGKPIPDISRLTAPVKIAEGIAKKVLDELRDYIHFVMSDPRRRSGLEARALLPQEILPLCTSEKLKQFRIWARGIADKGGFVPVGEIVARHKGRQIKSINKILLTKVADALAHLGFGFVPDPRFALRFPKVGEPAKIFKLGKAFVKLEDASETYRMTLINVALGVFVARVDGEVTEGARKLLSNIVIDTKNLADHEQRRLRADLDWLLANAPRQALLSRKLKEIKPDAVPATRKVLYSIANADGVVRPQKVAVIKKFYRALGLDPALAYSDLHMSNNYDRLVNVRITRPLAPGEAASTEYPIQEVELDAERIASIHSDTDRVSSVLGEIFDNTADELESKGAHDTRLPGLDTEHAELIKEIVEKDCWTIKEFQELCARYSFMASGAMEDVNEWAFEVYGEALLDEYDGYEVNSDVADALKKTFRGDSSNVQAETV